MISVLKWKICVCVLNIINVKARVIAAACVDFIHDSVKFQLIGLGWIAEFLILSF